MPIALFAGDVTLDLTMRIDHVPAPDEKLHVTSAEEVCGGVVANAAVACRVAGGSPRLLAQIGDDRAGQSCVADLAGSGIACDVVRSAGPTCRVVILLEPHGEKRLLLYPGVSLSISRRQAETADLAGISWMHTAVYDAHAGATLVKRCREADVPWSLDLEPATFDDGIETLAACLDGAEAVFCNSRAAARLGPDPVRVLRDRGVRSVIWTRGPDGAWLFADGAGTHCPAPRDIPVVDTTGAGDGLAGWYVAERMNGRDAIGALRRAVIAATLSCSKPGAQASYPNPGEVEARLHASSEPV